MKSRQRLVLCLDGTWNVEDSSTNVLHHFNLVREGTFTHEGRVFSQKKKYIPGVGTGVLDRFTGGGFGFGLDQNVRGAYDWLVENFEEGDTHQTTADEIYVFGFSRGAYTARSLVGFISRCGLLRRGAPLTVSQLWDEYAILGMEHEDRASSWDWLLGKQEAGIHQISDVMWDPWLAGQGDRQEHGALPGQRMPDGKLTMRDELLIRWSRRVRITYLGIYDTVGALGLDALAIPVLKSHLAMHHNMRPTTIIQKCRHALAIDEQRSSFNHTPFVAYIGPGAEEEQKRGDESRRGSIMDMWNRKIEQHWFTGAHSNVGGGYEDNLLAHAPLDWVLGGACDLGLACETIPRVAHYSAHVLAPQQTPRDSYAQFAPPLWALVMREKRNYRHIRPDEERRADQDQLAGHGFILRNINEKIHDTVDTALRERHTAGNSNGAEIAPNLAHYAEQALGLNIVKPRPDWLRGGMADWAVLLLWSLIAVAGISAIEVFIPQLSFGLGGALLCAFLFPLADWAESRANFSQALRGPSPFRSAVRDTLYWLRAGCFVLLVCGALLVVVNSLRWGWQAEWPSLAAARGWWPVPLAALAGIVTGKTVDGWPPHLSTRTVSWKWPALFVGAPVALTLVAALASRLFSNFVLTVELPWRMAQPVDSIWQQAGLLLLLELAVLFFVGGFHMWIGQPMGRANLGSITKLQIRPTAPAVKNQLDRWTQMLERNGETRPNSASTVMCACVKEALWRDTLGFVPLYAFVFGFGLWFATSLGWHRLEARYLGMPLWALLPLAAALADWGQNICQFAYLRFYERGLTVPGGLPPLGFTLSMVKFAAFISAALVTIAAIAVANDRVIAAGADAGWRGTLITLIAVIAGITLLGTIIGVLVSRGSKPSVHPSEDPKQKATANSAGKR